MARVQYAEVFETNAGVPLNGASVNVKSVNADGSQGGNATIYVSETGAPSSNPISTGADGYATFWAEAGARYDVIVSAAGFTTRTVRWEAIQATATAFGTTTTLARVFVLGG